MLQVLENGGIQHPNWRLWVEQRHPRHISWRGHHGARATIWKTWAGITPDAHEFGDAIKGHGKT